MAAAPTSTDSAPRVPAWKRLGLKLKYAKDTPTEAQSEVTTTTVASPAPRPVTIEAPVKPAKRSLETPQAEIPAKRSRIESAKPALREKPFPGSAPKTKTAGQQVWNDEDRSSLPGPSGVFKAPGQSAKRTVFDDDE